MSEIYQRHENYAIDLVTGEPVPLSGADGQKLTCETVEVQASLGNAAMAAVGGPAVTLLSGQEIGPGDCWEFEIARIRELQEIKAILLAQLQGTEYPVDPPRLVIDLAGLAVIGTTGDQVRVFYTYSEEAGT